MPTVDDLTALMRKGPLNSITLVAATHRKLEKIERKKTVVVCIILESFCNKALENLEEEPLLGSNPRIKFHTSPTCLLFKPTYNRVQLLWSSLKPSSWTHSLQIYCIGLVGLELTRVIVEVLKPSPYNYYAFKIMTNFAKELMTNSNIYIYIYIWWVLILLQFKMH